MDTIEKTAEKIGPIRKIVIDGMREIRALWKKIKKLEEKPEEKLEEQVIISKEEIEAVLPHRGRMLLLDRVIITPEKIIGEIAVTEEICQGHAFDGKMVFKGSDFLDMAAQVLGVWACQYEELKGKLAFARAYDGAKFRSPVFVSDILTIEVLRSKVKAEIDIRPKAKILTVFGSDFIAFAKNEKKASIRYVELANVERQEKQ